MVNDREYVYLRHELLTSDNTLSKLLPEWLRTNSDTKSFWKFIQPKFATYAERRTFLKEEFTPALNYAKFGGNKADKRPLFEKITGGIDLENDTADFGGIDLENDTVDFGAVTGVTLQEVNDNASQKNNDALPQNVNTINIQKISLNISSLLGILEENVEAVDKRTNSSPSIDLDLRGNAVLLLEIRKLIKELRQTRELIKENSLTASAPPQQLREEALREFVLKFSGATGEGLGKSITWTVRLSCGLLAINIMEGLGYSVSDLYRTLANIKPPSN